jgi:hypothetical protein
MRSTVILNLGTGRRWPGSCLGRFIPWKRASTYLYRRLGGSPRLVLGNLEKRKSPPPPHPHGIEPRFLGRPFRSERAFPEFQEHYLLDIEQAFTIKDTGR